MLVQTKTMNVKVRQRTSKFKKLR